MSTRTPIPPPIPSMYPYSDFPEAGSQDAPESDTVDGVPLLLHLTKHEVEEGVFEIGVYRHYEGGYYYASALGWYRESGRRKRVVIYMSTATCEFFVLPWCDPVHSSWTDEVQLEEGAAPVRRFTFIARSIHHRVPVF